MSTDPQSPDNAYPFVGPLDMKCSNRRMKGTDQMSRRAQSKARMFAIVLALAAVPAAVAGRPPAIASADSCSDAATNASAATGDGSVQPTSSPGGGAWQDQRRDADFRRESTLA